MSNRLIKWHEIHEGQLIRLTKTEEDRRSDYSDSFKDETIKTRKVTLRVYRVVDEGMFATKNNGTFTKGYGWTTIEVLEEAPLPNGLYIWRNKAKSDSMGLVEIKDGQAKNSNTEWWYPISSAFGENWPTKYEFKEVSF